MEIQENKSLADALLALRRAAAALGLNGEIVIGSRDDRVVELVLTTQDTGFIEVTDDTADWVTLSPPMLQ